LKRNTAPNAVTPLVLIDRAPVAESYFGPFCDSDPRLRLSLSRDGALTIQGSRHDHLPHPSYWMTLGSGDIRTAERVVVTPARPDLHHDGRTSCRRLSPTISYPRSIWPSAIATPVRAPTLKPTDPCRPLARLGGCPESPAPHRVVPRWSLLCGCTLRTVCFAQCVRCS
jgi:hypothetical protein